MLDYLHCEDSRGIGAVAPKTALPYSRDSCICNGIAAIFYEQAWDLWHNRRRLAFWYSTSNVYGNAIRAKLAAAQTTRSVAGSFSSFVTQNLQSICSLYHRHPRFFHKSSESDSIANTWIPAIRLARGQKLFLFPQSVAKQKKKKPNFFAKNGSGGNNRSSA